VVLAPATWPSVSGRLATLWVIAVLPFSPERIVDVGNSHRAHFSVLARRSQKNTPLRTASDNFWNESSSSKIFGASWKYDPYHRAFSLPFKIRQCNPLKIYAGIVSVLGLAKPHVAGLIFAIRRLPHALSNPANPGKNSQRQCPWAQSATIYHAANRFPFSCPFSSAHPIKPLCPRKIPSGKPRAPTERPQTFGVRSTYAHRRSG